MVNQDSTTSSYESSRPDASFSSSPPYFERRQNCNLSLNAEITADLTQISHENEVRTVCFSGERRAPGLGDRWA
jgi:hypothetical protein